MEGRASKAGKAGRQTGRKLWVCSSEWIALQDSVAKVPSVWNDMTDNPKGRVGQVSLGERGGPRRVH